jgi:hypothetical protein
VADNRSLYRLQAEGVLRKSQAVSASTPPEGGATKKYAASIVGRQLTMDHVFPLQLFPVTVNYGMVFAAQSRVSS